jgi:hypothetical protein
VFAAKRGRVSGEHGADDLRGLFELILTHPDAREGYAVLAVFLLVPARSQTGFQTAVADVIDCGESLGQHRGMAVTDAKHQAADQHAAGVHRHQRKGRDRFEARAAAVNGGSLIEVIPDRQPVEPGPVDKPPHAPQFLQRAILLSGVDTECAHDASAAL